MNATVVGPLPHRTRPRPLPLALVLLLHLAALAALLLARSPRQPAAVPTVQVRFIQPSNPKPPPPQPSPKVSEPRLIAAQAQVPTAIPPPRKASLRAAALDAVPPAPVLPVDQPENTVRAAAAPAARPEVPVQTVPPNFVAAYLDNPAPAYPPGSRERGEQGVVRLRVKVGVDGRAERVEVQRGSGFFRLDRAAARVVREQWRFEPARAGEQPRAGATTVFVDACAVPSVDGAMRLAVDYGWNGPGYADGRYFHPAPRYPVEAARRNKGGAFRVVLQIGTDGRATVETIEAQEGQLPLFEQALRTWVASLRYVPEEIDGAPVATRVAIPVDFSMGGPGLREYRRQEREARQQSPECRAAMGAEDASPSQPVVLDSPFRPVTAG